MPLTVMQSPPDGCYRDLALELAVMVKKAIKMARMLEVPILGLVENRSDCPHCGKPVESSGRLARRWLRIPESGFWGRFRWIRSSPALVTVARSSNTK